MVQQEAVARFERVSHELENGELTEGSGGTAVDEFVRLW